MYVTDSYCGLMCGNITAFHWTDRKTMTKLNGDVWHIASKISSSAGRTENFVYLQNFVLVSILLGRYDAGNNLKCEDILRFGNLLEQRGKWRNLVLS